jgi:hypothetical protein
LKNSLFENPQKLDRVRAREELRRIVAAMRGAHGPKLRDIPGRVLYGTEYRPSTSTEDATMRL